MADQIGLRIVAMKRAIALGRKLQQDSPQIADLYREGRSQYDIVGDLGIEAAYTVSREVARNAVRNALGGCASEDSKMIYEGLLEEDEMRRISLEHRRNSSRRVANDTLERAVGIHGRDRETRVRDSINAVIKRGELPWKRSGDSIGEGKICEVGEMERAYQLSLLPNYRTSTGNRVSNVKVARQINLEYHEGRGVRNSQTVRLAIRRYLSESDKS